MRKLLLTVSVLFTFYFAKSQTFTPPPYADINTDYQNYVNNVFGLLEPNRVSTGLLLDYGFAFTNPKMYNGNILHDSTLIESGIFSNIYQTLFTSRFNNNITMRHPSIHDSIWNSMRQKEVITLSGLLFKYNVVNTKAKIFGLMEDVNGQLKDVYVNGVWQNPYQQFTTLAISPSITSYNLTYGTVKLPSDLWLTNMGAEVSNIQFNADDGLGYRTVQMDNNISFSYADTGWKHWVFRINLTNGLQLHTHTKVHISNISNFAGSGTPLQRGTVLDKIILGSAKKYLGIGGIADIVISYRNDNDRVIRKPLIVAEGLDPGHIVKPEEPEGSNTYLDFLDRVDRSGSNNLRQLLYNGSTSEYDIIYINWRNGTDYLQRNAYLLESIITYVNSVKQPPIGSSTKEKNVIMGFSMGSVLARMALGDMERSNPAIPHDTRLYISMDGPQQGSNVPLGIQAGLRHGRSMYLKTGPLPVQATVAFFADGLNLSGLLKLADQPAAKQIMIERIDATYNTDNSVYNQFQNELRTQWQYPNPNNVRSIVVSNGSECAVDQEFLPGSNLVYFERNTKTRVLGDVVLMLGATFLNYSTFGHFPAFNFFIPGSQEFHAKFDIRALANGGGNQVYYGKVSYTKKVLWLVPVTIKIGEKTFNARTGLPSYDTYPGSFLKVEMKKEFGSASQDWMFTYDNTFQVNRRFTHVLTTSALDIGGGAVPLTNTQYFAKYVGETPPAAPYNTPFQNFTTAYSQTPLVFLGPNNPNTNQPAWQFTSNGSEFHGRFFLRNANFVAAELNGNTTTVTNCSAFCSGNINNWPSAICNQQVITIPGAGSGLTVVWDASPAGIITINGTGGSATVTPVGTGQVTITATLTGNAVNACGVKTLSKLITVGTPAAPFVSPSNFDAQCGTFAEAYATIPPGTTGHVWNLNYGMLIKDQDGYGSNYFYTAPLVNTPQTGLVYYNYLSVQAKNACGLSDPSPIISMTVGPVPTNCSGGGGPILRVVMSPVPTGNQLNIAVNTQEMQQNGNNNPAWMQIREVSIYDKFGVMRKRKQFGVGSQQVNIPVQDLPNDVYNVHVTNGVHSVLKTILIQR